jgi:hypothetical protein
MSSLEILRKNCGLGIVWCFKSLEISSMAENSWDLRRLWGVEISRDLKQKNWDLWRSLEFSGVLWSSLKIFKDLRKFKWKDNSKRLLSNKDLHSLWHWVSRIFIESFSCPGNRPHVLMFLAYCPGSGTRSPAVHREMEASSTPMRWSGAS